MRRKTYSELIRLHSFEERFKYLKLGGSVGRSTFGFDRFLNQVLYRSPEWKRIRQEIIIRDRACDLGITDREIFDKIIVHHMNPLTVDDIEQRNPDIFDPEFLICVSHNTHNAIHFGDEKMLNTSIIRERTKGDTCPWK